MSSLPGTVELSERPQPTAAWQPYHSSIELPVMGEVIAPWRLAAQLYRVMPPPTVEGSNMVNVPVPDTWVYRKDWRRVFLYRLVGMEPAHDPAATDRTGHEDAYYECQMPRAPGQICGEIIRDRLCSGKDLESHAAAVHDVVRYPQRFQKPFKQWSSSICDCATDVPACFDCLFCPFCFIARLRTVTEIRYERKVLPYVSAFNADRTGCTDGTCGSLVANVVVQPWLWCLWPCGLCGFCDSNSKQMSWCFNVFPPIGRTKVLQGIDESDCETKCKAFWCCPLALCQTYRELRQMGVNPGLTCCSREPVDAFTVEATRTYHAHGQPKLQDFLEANHGGLPRTMLAPNWPLNVLSSASALTDSAPIV